MSEVSTGKSIAIATLAGVNRKLKEGQLVLLLGGATAIGSTDPDHSDPAGGGAVVEHEVRKASFFVDGIVLYDAVLTPHDASQSPVEADAIYVFPDAVKAIMIGAQAQGGSGGSLAGEETGA